VTDYERGDICPYIHIYMYIVVCGSWPQGLSDASRAVA